MPLCIAGMHRSGTSLIAKALHVCGLELGPERDFLRPNSGNPEGYWEHRGFLRINDAILKHLGGTWDSPPWLDAVGWEVQPGLGYLATKAMKLLRSFRDREPWGWKDPRNCITLPFWRKLVPELKVLVCVRNPLAAAESLQVRDGIACDKVLDLWLTYNQCLLEAAPAANRVVIHYDKYLQAPREELVRVLEFMGMSVDRRDLDRASAVVNPSLVHQMVKDDALAGRGVAAKTIALYQRLREEANHTGTPSIAQPSGG